MLEAVGLAVVLDRPKGVELGDGVGTARIERRRLLLRHLLHLAVELRGRGLVEARLHAREADRLQEPHRAERVNVAGEIRRVEADAHVTLRGEVVHFVRLDVVDEPHEVRAVRKIAVMQEHPHVVDVGILIEIFDPARVERAGAADEAVNLIALAQQQLREVAAVLSGDTGDQRLFS